MGKFPTKLNGIKLRIAAQADYFVTTDSLRASAVWILVKEKCRLGLGYGEPQLRKAALCCVFLGFRVSLQEHIKSTEFIGMKPQPIVFQELGNNLSGIFDRVVQRHEIFSVEKAPGQTVVMLDADEYAGLLETLYLLSNPENAARLQEGMAQHRSRSSKGN